jgi:hypothetical protein
MLEMIHMMDWPMDLTEKDKSFECLEQVEMVSITDIQ